MSTTASYTVTGMTCEHCVDHVTEEVSAIDGVTGVEVALADGSMVVTSDVPIDFARITEAVEEAGDYRVAAA
ncbi:heavy metal-associated domain-containing protein [uncultured Propionibacterium sp.]|uniref:heavy-metal-associated domain-containing protein n=1 Tax=uncultured Propionibacterium sp. TaxID=218066 RepID=UPI0029313D99|nr:heavy metal-associated domain-containing protein [uncultured Propionibacterium sp.]